MPMTAEDAAYEDYMEKLYEEHRNIAIEDFTSERLVSYYLENNDLAKPAFYALENSKKLFVEDPTASLIFSAIAIEVGLKSTILKPIVYGLVHTESVASLVTDLAISHSGMDRYRDLLFCFGSA